MSRLAITCQGETVWVEAGAGETLLSALQRADVPVQAPCGGLGRCKKCRVKLIRNGQTSWVLACETIAEQGDAVEVPELAGGVIARSGGRDSDWPKQAPDRAGFGIAVDLGTTTTVVQLFSLSGEHNLMGTKAEWNAQAAFGGDVISRAQYCMTHPDGVEKLSHVIRQQVFAMAKTLCEQAGVGCDRLTEAAVAGNTIMQHLFAGLDPSAIAVAPYRPSTLFLDGKPEYYPELPGTGVTFFPCVAGYVGGDITAGLLAGQVMQEQGLALFLDIGTNGEMALWDGVRFYCCSVASGPAFEGAEITCGMSSVSGAVSHVDYINGQFQLQVIGGGEAQGLCGSGLIDLLAVLLELEVVDETGWLLPPDEAEDAFAPRLTEDENGNGCFHLTPAVRFTAGDVRKLQLAKAAVAAGIELLLKEAGHRPDEVEVLFLAGGFGDNLKPSSAARIGMIPQELTDKVICLGNSSLAGARWLLLDPGEREQLLEIQRRCHYIELSGNQAFSTAFVDHMTFEEDE